MQNEGESLEADETGQSTTVVLPSLSGSTLPTVPVTNNTAVIEGTETKSKTSDKDGDEDISIVFDRVNPPVRPVLLTQGETSQLKIAGASKTELSEDAFNCIQTLIKNKNGCTDESQGQGNATTATDTGLKLPEVAAASSTTNESKGSISATDGGTLTAAVSKDAIQIAITAREAALCTTGEAKDNTNHVINDRLSDSELERENKNVHIPESGYETITIPDDGTQTPEGENDDDEEDDYSLFSLTKRKRGDTYYGKIETPAKRIKDNEDNDDAEQFFKDEWECNFEDKVSVFPEKTGESTTDDLAENDDSHNSCRAEKQSLCTKIESLHGKVDRLMQRQMLLEDFATVQYPTKFRTFYNAREILLNIGKTRSSSDPDFVLAPGSSYLISVLKSINEKAYGPNAEMTRQEVERIEAECRKNVKSIRGRSGKTSAPGGSRWSSDLRTDRFAASANNTAASASTVSTNNTNSYGGTFQNPFYYSQQQEKQTTETLNNYCNSFYASPSSTVLPQNRQMNLNSSFAGNAVSANSEVSKKPTAATYNALNKPMSDAGSDAQNILGTGKGKSRNKKMECEVCGKIISKNTLNKHLSLHIGMIYECPVCKVGRTFVRFAQKCLKEHESKEHENDTVQVYLLCDDGTRRLVQKDEEESIRENFLNEVRRCKLKMSENDLKLDNLNKEPGTNSSEDEELIRQLGIQRQLMMHEQSVQRQNTSQQDSLYDQQRIQHESYMRQQELLFQKSIMGECETEDNEQQNFQDYQDQQKIEDQSIHQQELIQKNIQDQHAIHQQRSVQLNELLKQQACNGNSGINNLEETQGLLKNLPPLEKGDVEYLAQTRVPIKTSVLLSNISKINSNISNIQNREINYGYFTAPPQPKTNEPKVTIVSYETGGITLKNKKKKKKRNAKMNGEMQFVPPTQDYGYGEPVGASSVPPLFSQFGQQAKAPMYGQIGPQAWPSGQGVTQSATGGQGYTRAPGQAGQIQGYIRQAQTSYFTTQQGSNVGREEYGKVLRAGSGQQQWRPQAPLRSTTNRFQSSTSLSSSSYGEFKSYAEYAKTFLQTRPYMR